VTILPLNGFTWDTYTEIEDKGLLDDIERAPWHTLHPQLHFISHLPVTVMGDQFVSQLFRSIPEKSWLFKYGRVPMGMVMAGAVWDRIMLPHGNLYRSKLGVVAECTAQLRTAVSPSSIAPYQDHFHPPSNIISPSKSSAAAKKTQKYKSPPMAAVNIIPHAEQLVEKGKMEIWDYILRKLFIVKAKPLKNGMSFLAPGANSLLKMLTDPSLPPEQRVDTSLSPRQLTIADWALIARAFDNWPFAPEDLGIADVRDSRNT